MEKRDMYLSAAKVVRQSRGQVLAIVEGLSAEQWMMIPAGHDNNIAWNVGHLIWGQIGLTYGHSNLVAPIDRTPYISLYGIGTSPATWADQPKPEQLLETFISSADKMIEDATGGIFDDVDFQPWETSAGAKFNTLLDMMIYNTAHEGEHRGMIMALKNLAA